MFELFLPFKEAIIIASLKGCSMKNDNYQSSYCDFVLHPDLEISPCT
jgi:hypothetical protein